MIVYFSGTGNSRYCAQYLAHELDDEILDAGHYIRHGIAADLISGKPWVFVCPTYAWQLPGIFDQFIRAGDFKGSAEAYFVMTCGDDIGNAAAYIKPLCAALQRKVTICARVQVFPGLKVSSLVPVATPLSTAHAIDS